MGLKQSRIALARRNVQEENDKKIFSSLKHSFLPRLPWLVWPHLLLLSLFPLAYCGAMFFPSLPLHLLSSCFPRLLSLSYIRHASKFYLTTQHHITQTAFYSHRHQHYTKSINCIKLRHDRVLSSAFQFICISYITFRRYITYATDRVVDI